MQHATTAAVAHSAALASAHSASSLTPEARRERMFWALYLETNDAIESLADTVLTRLTPKAETHLLTLDAESRQRVQERLRDDAIARLGRLAVTDEQYDRACGHPTLLAELALESQGHYLTAAALHAINHDNLAMVLESDQLLALRFKTARALVRAGGITHVSRGIALMEQALDLIDDDRNGRRVRAEVLAWLSRRYAELGLEDEAVRAKQRAREAATGS